VERGGEARLCMILCKEEFEEVLAAEEEGSEGDRARREGG